MRTRFVLAALAVVLLAACGDPSSDALSDGGAASPVTAPAAADDGTLPEVPLGAGPYPVATLDITITHPDADDVAYTITCLGDTATVTGDVDLDEGQACTDLAEAAVRVRLLEGVPDGQMCTQLYGGPDVAHIVGTYDGESVDTSIDRTNGCGIGDWDQLLANVLPGALGVTGG